MMNEDINTNPDNNLDWHAVVYGGLSWDKLDDNIWYKLSKEVKLRDNGMCLSCGKRDRLTVHHLKPRSEGGTDDLRNLVCLCTSCHNKAELVTDVIGSLTLNDLSKLETLHSDTRSTTKEPKIAKICLETLDLPRTEQNLHPRIDEIEARFVDKGQSSKQIAKSLHLTEKLVTDALLSVGLEVNNDCAEGLVHSRHAKFQPLLLS